ncbi:DUF3175 domain-containing protein [Agrobacterium radiobacter]|uniref:DUF3175 domain-containing protein n=1 Tax=Agrobacterium radiobacter TaxID=362 RepID=UPI002B1BE34E|nr:DUF3175 domain-containing protein [Agrobacterium radiobacter]
MTRESDALDLEKEVFTKSEPSQIARPLKDSADQSDSRKANPFRSAMSMRCQPGWPGAARKTQRCAERREGEASQGVRQTTEART